MRWWKRALLALAHLMGGMGQHLYMQMMAHNGVALFQTTGSTNCKTVEGEERMQIEAIGGQWTVLDQVELTGSRVSIGCEIMAHVF